MFDELNKESLTEIKEKNMKKLSCEDVLESTKDLSAEDRLLLDEYFSKFVKSDGCPCCTNKYGHVQWGLCHGEAFCSCGYPYKGVHYDIGPIKALKIMLPYHPDGLSFDTEEDEECQK